MRARNTAAPFIVIVMARAIAVVVVRSFVRPLER